MARIYAINQNHNCDYGVDFFNGVAAIPDDNYIALHWLEEKGYEIVQGINKLMPWDYLTFEQLLEIAKYTSIVTTDMTKQELVAAIETELISKMYIDIKVFDEIPDINGGKVGDVEYADATAVKAALPDTVKSTFADGLVVTVPVSAWVDTDTYNAGVAGSYTFTANLGTLPSPLTNSGNKTATVEVVIASAS